MAKIVESYLDWREAPKFLNIYHELQENREKISQIIRK